MATSRRKFLQSGLLAAAASASTTLLPPFARGAQANAKTIKAVMHADLRVFDPLWTTANITAYHGALVYDALFAMDDNFRPQPQMVRKWGVSADKKTYTFELRDGLSWHDGTPVTSADCVASIRRFASVEGAGQLMMQFVRDIYKKDDKVFAISLKEPLGIVIEVLGKVSARLCFMMRKSDADKPATEQVATNIGSGPFIFNRAEAKPGVRFVYDRNPKYIPRSGPPSGLAGGKVVKVDRVIFENISDEMTAMSALRAGEIDFYEIPPIDLLSELESDPKLKVEVLNKTGTIGFIRVNWLHRPFSEKKARQALLYLVDQNAFMKVCIGNPKYYKPNISLFSNDSPLANEENTEWFRHGADLERARRLFQESGYKGEPVVVLDPTNHPWIHACSQLLASQLRKIGVNAQLAASDWGGVVNRRANRETIDKGGWDLSITGDSGVCHDNPFTVSTLAANGPDAWFGWPNNPQYEALRRKWVTAATLKERQQLAREMQRIAWDDVFFVKLGVFFRPVAYRSNLRGMIKMPSVIPFWNVEKV